VYGTLPHLLLLLLLLLVHQPTFRHTKQSKALINNASSWLYLVALTHTAADSIVIYYL
jgi:hypothetical protein